LSSDKGLTYGFIYYIVNMLITNLSPFLIRTATLTTALGYNIDLAVEARRVLMFEATPYEECMRLVYEPTLQLLKELLASNPTELVCLRGPIIYPEKANGSYCDLDVVGPQNQIIHIGTVRDRLQSQDRWKWFLKINHHLPDRVRLLENRGPMTIIRHRIRCDIPVLSEQLDLPAMEEGLRKFLRTFLPQFECEDTKITWLDKQLQQNIERQIKDEARQRAVPQTEAEKRRIFDMDKF
jgi:hypothetical protein